MDSDKDIFMMSRKEIKRYQVIRCMQTSIAALALIKK